MHDPMQEQEKRRKTLKHIIPFITEKLYLKINLEKTTVSHINKVKYLGYAFTDTKGNAECGYMPSQSGR